MQQSKGWVLPLTREHRSEKQPITSTLADTLRVLGPALPPSLISPENLANMSAIVRHLPGAITTFFGFECRLGDDAPWADILLRVVADEAGVATLAGDGDATSLSATIQDNAIWRRLGDFCRRWAEPTSPLHEKVTNIWLEFDVGQHPPEVPLPSCFFGPQPIRAGDSGQWVTEMALPLLLGDSLPAPLEHQLLECIAGLPGETYVFQIGAMLARKTEALRLCVQDLAPEQMPAYLADLGWPGPTGELEALISNLDHLVDQIALDLDAGQSILPKIGLECYFEGRKQPKYEPRWYEFLDYLGQLGVCCPAKRDGLLAYPGLVRESAHQSLWPSHLRATPNYIGGYLESIFFTGLHHVKIVYQPDCPLEAKAYLYVAQAWLPTAPATQQSKLAR